MVEECQGLRTKSSRRRRLSGVPKKTKKENKEETEIREEQQEPKQPVPSRRKIKARPAPVLTKPNERRSYSEVLNAIRTNVETMDAGAEVSSVRRKRTGDIMVELVPGTKS